MPRTLILHIGTMKTGSTAIQHALSSNREAMLARGVCYPGPPDAMHHLLFAMLFTSFRDAYADFGNVLWRGRDPQLLLQEYRQGFTAEIAALPEHVGRVIVSSEQLGQLVREGEDIARLRAEMAELFDDFRIIVYLRRQDSHFISSYSQTLRNGMIRKPAFRRLREHRHVYDYHALLDAWAAVFGQDAVLPRIFENSPGAPFDVVADFLSVTGLDGLAVKPSGARAANPSMNAQGQRLLREIGHKLKAKYGREFSRTALWRRLTTAVTEALPGRGWQPARAEAEEFVARFADSNEAVRRRWFPDRPSLFSTDFTNLPERPEHPKFDSEGATTVLLHVLQQTMDREQEAAKAALRTQQSNHRARRLTLLRSIKRDPLDVEARLELAEIQIEEGAMEAARFNVQAALKVEPTLEAGLGLLRRIEERLLF